MSIINYFFIGSAFTFLCDLLLNVESIKNHPRMKNSVWGWNERIACILFWPIALLIYLYTFIKSVFK